MISEKMQEALNGQLNAELYSSYLYLSMAAYFQDLNMGGCANWMRVQAQEEDLKTIDGPPTEWDSPLAAFEAVLEHEQKVTGLINELVELALAEHDHATNIFLQWFVTEQVEEEDSANDVIQQIKMVGEAQGGLFMLDRELGQRTFTAPAEE
jgi:ferritin